MNLRSTLFALALLCLAGPAGAADDAAFRLAGTWVRAETLRDLDAGTVTDPSGCHLVISAEPVGVLEVCRGWSGAWQGPLRLEEKDGRIELEGTGAQGPDGLPQGFGVSGPRRAVVRAGIPNELQLGSGGRVLEGLYRLDAARVEKLQAWMDRPLDPPHAREVHEETAAHVEEPTGPAPIAQPIAPKSRLCGCGAAEGSLGAGAIWLALGGLRRRRRS